MGIPPALLPPAIPPPAPPLAPTTWVGQTLLVIKENAEWYCFGLFLITLVIWLLCLPRRTEPYYQDELHKAVNAAASNPLEKQALSTDLEIWTRYESELRTFEWGNALNWYFYASFRVLVIALSAMTPALIVAPGLANKKFLAALPAVIVAIGSGFISEFDYRLESARYHSALVQLEGEKMAFLAGSSPSYGSASGTKREVPSASSNDSNLPYPEPHTYFEKRANFAYQIEKIYQDEASERDRFLRGTKELQGTAQVATLPDQKKKSQTNH